MAAKTRIHEIETPSRDNWRNTDNLRGAPAGLSTVDALLALFPALPAVVERRASRGVGGEIGAEPDSKASPNRFVPLRFSNGHRAWIILRLGAEPRVHGSEQEPLHTWRA